MEVVGERVRAVHTAKDARFDIGFMHSVRCGPGIQPSFNDAHNTVGAQRGKEGTDRGLVNGTRIKVKDLHSPFLN